MAPRKTRPARSLDPRALHVRVLDVLLQAGGTRVKPGILHRTARRISTEILRSRLSSIDPVHFTVLDLVYGINELDAAPVREAVLALGRYVLRGRVLPVQRVHELLGEAAAVFFGRCPCRASGRVRDRPEPVRGARTEDEPSRLLLDRLLGCWADPAVRRAAALPLGEALDRVGAARRAGRPGGTLEDLFAATWPYWEILLDHPAYDSCWRDGLAKNRKVWRLPRSLAHAWVDALYLGRGVVFTHMEATGLPYAICSCPGPETDGGCMLTNWHYFSGNDEVLVPNDELGFGRRRDAAGAVQPCRKHPERGERPCLGCGCEHREEPATPPEEQEHG